MSEAPDRVFTPDYEERLTTRSGRAVVLRLIGPEHKPLLLAGLARMSPESRYRRFFAHRDHLSDVELAYLTEVDHEDHFALGVAHERPDGSLEGLGVARFIRLADDPTIAELAIALVDDWHGEGLGRALLSRLVVAGRERGIAAFRLDVLADNDNMLGVVQKVFPEAHAANDDGVVAITCPLPHITLEPEAPKSEAPLFELMRLAAQGAARVLQSMRNWPVGTVEIQLDDDDAP